MSNYSIQLVSNFTGLSIHTLRAWEKRYQAVVPERSDNGRRVYSESEVRKLKVLNELCSIGHSIGTIASKDITELEKLLDDCGVVNSSKLDDINILNDPIKAKDSLNHLLIALENYRLDIISHEFHKMRMTLSPRDLALNIVSPLMGEVGKYVDVGRLTIAQEHALSSVIKFHLGSFIYRSFEEKQRGDDLYIITTPDGEYHEFGIMLASLLCLQYKKSFFYLGPNMPSASLIDSVKSIGATKVIIGTTISMDPKKLEKYIKDLLSGLPKDIELVVGGQGYYDLAKFKKSENHQHLPSLNHLDLYLKGES